MRGIRWLCLFVLFASFASAATIHGSVYDLSLEKVDNALVEINTTPKQVIVSQNGSYSFIVANGAYGIKAKLMQRNEVLAFVQENITIKQDGSYRLDLILFPDVEEGVGEVDFDINGDIAGNGTSYIFVFAIALIAAITLLFYFKKLRAVKKEMITVEKEIANVEEAEDGIEQVLKIIKKEGGRATQKDIRKQIPLSEAKISLMIAELEHKGHNEKIKKGRGNIIILKK